MITFLYYQRDLIQKNKRDLFFKAFKDNNYLGIIWFVSTLDGIY